jgi:hypothetical protein
MKSHENAKLSQINSTPVPNPVIDDEEENLKKKNLISQPLPKQVLYNISKNSYFFSLRSRVSIFIELFFFFEEFNKKSLFIKKKSKISKNQFLP